MTFEGVPWAIGGGAEHSPEVARLLAHSALGGADGVAAPSDLKVVPLDVPGAAVRVLIGAAAIPNRASGGSQQTYVGRNPSVDEVAVSATSSAGGRSDMVIVRVEDPFMAGEPWSEPTNVKVGPYIFTRVLSNVPASAIADNEAARAYLEAEGMSAIPVGGITLPPSTGTVTAGMVRDLRNLARPRSERIIKMNGPTPEQEMNNTGGAVWPDYRPVIQVPSWATSADVIATLSSIGQRVGGAQGYLTAVMGGGLNGVTGFRAADILYDLDPPVAGGSRHTLIVGGGFADIRSITGKNVYMQLEARKTNAAIDTGYLVTVDGTQVIYDINFTERIM